MNYEQNDHAREASSGVAAAVGEGVERELERALGSSLRMDYRLLRPANQV